MVARLWLDLLGRQGVYLKLCCTAANLHESELPRPNSGEMGTGLSLQPVERLEYVNGGSGPVVKR